MSKLRLAYIASLVAVVVLVFTMFRPLVRGGEYSGVQREGLVRMKEGWIAQFHLINREGREQNYTIVTFVGDRQPYKEEVRLANRQMFTFIESIQPSELAGGTGKVTFEIYKDGQSSPFEQATYHLK